MCKVYIVGNPNSGKTTLFNSLTKSDEHVGNWHGVTVDKKSKIIKFKNQEKEYEIIDLPGIYSLNAFSYEENISINEITANKDAKILYLIDANNFKRSLLLALDLLLQNKNIKILINNYKYFQKNGGNIDVDYLKKILGCDIEIVDARKVKINQEFFNFTTRETAFIKTLKNEIDENGEKNQECLDKYEKIEILYKYILKISNNCTKTANKIYGYSKYDNTILKLSIFLPVFILTMFLIIYTTFFLIGPKISEMFVYLLQIFFQKPVMAILNLATKSKFVLALFEEGIFGACFSVLGFLPQICLMYLFLSILENSGIISRMAFLLDDLLQKIGLNGKIVYTMLMGFGCSTSASLTAKNMADKNSQIKASLLTPFMSCSAKLPIYTMIATAICGVNSIWLIFGLYILGIVVAIILATIFEKTILPSKNSQFVIEFPPLKYPTIFNVWLSMKSSCKQFIVKVFGIIFGISILLWILTNVNIKFEYVGDSSKSILYSFSSIISWIFKPIGLDNPNIICALLIGLVAKELILSSFAISNKVANLELLSTSLTVASSAVYFNFATGVSFLVFTLLYFPCVSNFGVLVKEVGLKYTMFGVSLQLISAYMISYLIYTLLTKGVVQALILLVIILLIILSVKIIYQKIKSKKMFCNCSTCNKCK